MDDIFLLLGAVGLLVLQMFATVDIVGIMIKDKVEADKPEYIMYYIKHVLQYFEVQTVLFIRFRKMQIDKESMREGKHLVIKGMVVFVTVCNFERWMADRVLSPSALAFVFQLDFDFWEEKTWWFITECFLPIIIFYRLQAAIIGYDAVTRVKMLEAEKTDTSERLQTQSQQTNGQAVNDLYFSCKIMTIN